MLVNLEEKEGQRRKNNRHDVGGLTGIQAGQPGDLGCCTLVMVEFTLFDARIAILAEMFPYGIGEWQFRGNWSSGKLSVRGAILTVTSCFCSSTVACYLWFPSEVDLKETET